MRRAVTDALRLTMMLNVPAAVGLVVLAHPIVSLLLERGNFGPADTAATAGALMCYAPGILGYAVVRVACPTFYALGDSRTPVDAGALSVAVTVALSLAPIRARGVCALAVGTAVAASVNGALLLWLLRRRIGGLDGRKNARALARITIASLVMGLAAWGMHHRLDIVLPGGGTLVRAVRVFTSIAVALAVLVGAARVLRIEEFKEALARVASRLGMS